MLQGKFLSGEVLYGRPHSLRWCSGRHREHEFMDEFRRGPTPRFGEFSFPLMRFKIEIPVVEEIVADALTSQLQLIICFEIQLSPAANVVDVFLDRPRIVT